LPETIFPDNLKMPGQEVNNLMKVNKNFVPIEDVLILPMAGAFCCAGARRPIKEKFTWN
jgi:hypothetical protein